MSETTKPDSQPDLSNVTFSTAKPDAPKAPEPVKRYKLEFEAKPEAKPEEKPSAKPAAKPTDTDAVRTGLSSIAPTLFGRIAKAAKPDGKPDDEAKKAAEGKAADGKPATPEDKSGEAPSPDELRAEKILGKKSAKPATPAPAAEPEVQGERLSAREIADVAAQAAVNVVKAEKKVDAVVDYPEEYRENAKAFDHMAKTDPKRYGNLKVELVGFAEKERQYRTLWESQNEGEQFDPDSDDHADFYSKNTPNIDTRDLDAAEKAIEEERIASIVNERVNEQLNRTVAPLIAKQAKDSIRPIVQQQSNRFAVSALQAVMPDIDPQKLTPESLAEIEEKNPRQIQIINEAVARVSQVGEAYLKIVNQITAVDERNPVHAEAIDVVSRVQSFILSRPKDERLREDNGRVLDFMPVEKYAALPKNQRAKYWTVGPEEVARQLEIDAANTASKVWDGEKKVLERYGVKFETPKERKPNVMTPSQPASDKDTPQDSKREHIKVSRGMSERGGAASGDEVVTVSPTGSFARLMASLRPARLSQK